MVYPFARISQTSKLERQLDLAHKKQPQAKSRLGTGALGSSVISPRSNSSAGNRSQSKVTLDKFSKVAVYNEHHLRSSELSPKTLAKQRAQSS